jgi:hypothetical protein
MDLPAGGKQLFIGNSPESSDIRMLPIGGTEEREVILLLEEWLEKTQGFIRRETLMDADQSALKGQDLLDRLSFELFSRDPSSRHRLTKRCNCLQEDPVQACRKTSNKR